MSDNFKFELIQLSDSNWKLSDKNWKLHLIFHKLILLYVI